MSGDYRETLAQLRQEAHGRQIRELTTRAHELSQQVAENEQYALEAEASGDHDSALTYTEFAQEDAKQLTETLAKLPPSGPPEYAQRFFAEHKGFFDRHGERAFQAAAMAHQYATTAKDPENPKGMGLTPGTPEYDHAMKNLLEMYGKDVGVDFNPDEGLTADEAAKISGVSPREYNRQVRK